MAGALIRELHEASYRRLALELLVDADDMPTAEQAVRDAFVDAYRRGRALGDAADPIALLRDSATQILRRRGRRARLLARMRIRRSIHSPATDDRLLPDSRATLRAVTGLPREERAAVVLRRLADLPLAEAAAATGLSTDEVQARLQAARMRLAPALATDGKTYSNRIDDLAIDLRQAIGLPDFDDVIAAASRRRLRLAGSLAGGTAALAAVVAVSVGWPSGETSDTSGPDAATAGLRAALASPGTSMYAVAENISGTAATFWYCQLCASERSFALLSDDYFEHVRVVALSVDGQGEAWAAPTGDFVVTSASGDLEVITPDGDARAVTVRAHARPRVAGAENLVVTALSDLRRLPLPLVVDTARALAYPLKLGDFAEARAIDNLQSYPDGDIWGTHLLGPEERTGIVHSSDGGATWTTHFFAEVARDRIAPVGYPMANSQGQIGFVAISLAQQPGDPGVWLSQDGGRTWDHATAARDEDGRRMVIYDVGLTPDGALIVTGADDVGAPGVWLGTRDVDSFHRLRLVLREHVTLARPPLDRPSAIWATAPQAIWESDDEGRTWYLLASHLTWDHVDVVTG